ncbi:reverse transcriptase [Phytophthora megakarya]|uniref:Reverse transcriptase n=1 Tax=Phytophthora megakarya TaxID=4795 RepID=A0A225VYE7_9STRA|nr:reverse transcriptase [Phytophthora megakarya]
MEAYTPDLTVNEAEYHGRILCFDLLSTLDKGRVVICGNSNLVKWTTKHQACSCSDRAKPAALMTKARLGSAALQREEGEVITSEDDRQDLITLNRLGEKLEPKLIGLVVA